MCKDTIQTIAEDIAIKRFGCKFSQLSNELQKEALRKAKKEHNSKVEVLR